MSTNTLRDPELLLTPFCTLTRFPRMEWSRRWDRPTLPVGPGWHDAMVALLGIERIPSGGLRDRRIGEGKAAKPLTAKECARGLAPYELRHGDRRCKADVLTADAWTFVVHDIDAAPVAVVEMLDPIERAFGELAHATWTTWSCRDGYASARVFLLLSRTCTTEEAAAIWWWTRRLLVAAGMPESSAKAGEPTMDSRAMDGRLFYGPSVPTPMNAGVEGWGGVVPRGKVTDDDVPPLDVDAILADARRVRTEDEPVHLARFPGVPVPGAGTTRTPRVGASSKKRSAGSGRGPAERVDFATKAFEGTTLLEWVRANLAPGTEVNVGSPWRPDGGSGVAGRSLRLHHEIDGRIWAKDFPTNTTYHHELEVETSDIDFDALLSTNDGAIVEPLLTRADEFEADRKAGLVSDVFLFAKEMGEALTEHPLVIDHVALRVESRRLETLLDEPRGHRRDRGGHRGRDRARRRLHLDQLHPRPVGVPGRRRRVHAEADPVQVVAVPCLRAVDDGREEGVGDGRAGGPGAIRLVGHRPVDAALSVVPARGAAVGGRGLGFEGVDPRSEPGWHPAGPLGLGETVGVPAGDDGGGEAPARGSDPARPVPGGLGLRRHPRHRARR